MFSPSSTYQCDFDRRSLDSIRNQELPRTDSLIPGQVIQEAKVLKKRTSSKDVIRNDLMAFHPIQGKSPRIDVGL